VVHEEVAVDPEVFVGNVEVRSEEFDEEAGHRGIGVRELHRVAALRSLGPVEHASHRIARVLTLRHFASVVLERTAPLSRRVASAGHRSFAVVAGHSPGERGTLLRRQRDVANPVADR
jgi:hypothetical protein